MSKLTKKLDSARWAVRKAGIGCSRKVKSLIKNEDGDTNFLSIIIILAIVLVIAIVFIAFKEKIIEFLSGVWDEFEIRFGGTSRDFP